MSLDDAIAEPGLPAAPPSTLDPNAAKADRKSVPEVRPSSRWQRRRLSPEMLVGLVKLADFCLVLTGAVVAFAAYNGIGRYPVAELERYFLTSLVAAVIFVLGFRYIGGYEVKQLPLLRWQLMRAAAIWTATICLLLLIAFFAKVSNTYSRGWLLGWTATALGLLLVERSILRLLVTQWLREGRLARNAVIVGAGEHGQRLMEKFQRSQGLGIAVRGVFDDRRSRVPRSVCGSKVLGTTDELLQFAQRVAIDEIIIALPLSAVDRVKAVVDKLKPLPADLSLSAESIADKFPVRRLTHLDEVPLIHISDRPISQWNAVVKWTEDKVLSAGLLLLTAPLMAIIALLIKLESRGPVFFVQERFGFNNNAIYVLKFRTMYMECEDPSGAQRTVYGDPRVTRIGRILRAFSFDELPQLFNVLKGDMSLIGPRPHAVAMRAGELLYGDAIKEYAQRHRVKPGITGWAQVNGCRGEVDTLEKARTRVQHDLFYIDHWSLWLDLKVLLLTVPLLLSRRNAY